MRKDETPEGKIIDRLHVQDVEFHEVHETKPRTDETKISREHVTTEKVTVGRGDITHKEQTDKPKYPKEQNIGRIVIEEIPEKREEIAKPAVLRKEVIRPKTTGLTVMRREVEDIPGASVKEDVIKVGKLGLIEKEKAPVEPKVVEERITTCTETVDGARKVINITNLNSLCTKNLFLQCCQYADSWCNFFSHFQVRKGETLEKQRIDRLHVDDVGFDKVTREESKPRKDDTEVSRTRVTTEKVTVTRSDIARTEDMEEPEYPKDLDIRRIVIEEIPAERDETLKSQVTPKEAVKPRSTDVTITRHEVEEFPKTLVKEDVIKVGKLDVTDVEKTLVESRRVGERVSTYRERLEGARKVV